MISGSIAFVMTTADELELVHILDAPLGVKYNEEHWPILIYQVRLSNGHIKYVTEDVLFEATPMLVAKWKHKKYLT